MGKQIELLEDHPHLATHRVDCLLLIIEMNAINDDPTFLITLQMVDAADKVDLPDPDGPHRTIFSPARTVKLIFVRALKSLYHFSTPSITIMGCEEPSDVLGMLFIALTLLRLAQLATNETPSTLSGIGGSGRFIHFS